MIDVTDATFEEAVLVRSRTVPVVVDLWAPWCGPCKTLGPILESVVAATNGSVELVKVNVDENPVVASQFKVQSIPAVFALSDAKVVDGFIGALPEAEVRTFVAKLAPAPSEAEQLVAAGDEASLRKALTLEPGHQQAVAGLARLLLDQGQATEALEVLGQAPETAEMRALAAEARLAQMNVDLAAIDIDQRLNGLLEKVRDDDAARQEFIDLLEALGPEDPRTRDYRKALSARLF